MRTLVRFALRMMAPSSFVGERSPVDRRKLSSLRGTDRSVIRSGYPSPARTGARTSSRTLQSFALLGGEGRVPVASFGASS
jgi:hypothetical protein